MNAQRPVKDRAARALAASFIPQVIQQVAAMEPLPRHRMRRDGPLSNGELLGVWRDAEVGDGFGGRVRKVMKDRTEVKAEVQEDVGAKVMVAVWQDVSFRYGGAATALSPLRVTKELVRRVLEVSREVHLPNEVRHPRPGLTASRLDEVAKKTFDTLLSSLRSRSPEEWRSSVAVKVSFKIKS